jgi:hypothetical protein
MTPAVAYDVLTPGEGEIMISPGVVDNSYLISAAVRKSLTTCIDVGGAMVAIPGRNARSELFITSEIRYGLWYCCIPAYYLNYLYFSLGAGSFSRMGLGERENSFALTYGTGLRINILKKFIIGTELKAYSVFREGGAKSRIAFLLGLGLPI